MILLDTCAAIWVADGATDIDPAVRATVENASREARLAISAITAWEIATLARRERLRVIGAVDEYVRRLFALPGVIEVPVDRRIAARAGALSEFHGDPADRIVVATALALKAAVCTRDRKIVGYATMPDSPLRVLVC